MAQKTGYLAEKLKLFHLSDKRQWTCPYHYHDFDKITLFFRGHVSYDVEGTAYGVQNLIPGGGRVRGLAPTQLFADLLHRGPGVLRQHIRRHGAQDIFILSKRLQLKTQLGKKCAVFFQQLSIAPVKPV